MKKPIYLILIVQLILFACSKYSGPFETYYIEAWDMLIPYKSCTYVKDAIIFPERWTGEDLDHFENLSNKTFRKMSTCGLLKTLTDYPGNLEYGGKCGMSSSFTFPVITCFNDNLQSNKVAVELFKRSDCFSVLAGKYVTIIKDKEADGLQSLKSLYFELVLASDMCMSALNEVEKIWLMAMSLERRNRENTYGTHITYHIPAVIMRSFNYAPFLNEVGTEWREWMGGYSICTSSGDIIEKYARQFLNEQKSRIL